MPRPVKFPEGLILDTVVAIAAEHGANDVSVAGVARRLGAPGASIYHRYPSRDALLASAWLRTVERFQDGFLERLGAPDPLRAARDAAAYVLEWVGGHAAEARLLLLFRRTDLLGDDWPRDVRRRAQEAAERLERALDDLARRTGAVRPEERRRISFAVVDVPYAVARRALAEDRAPDALERRLADEAACGLLAALEERSSSGGGPGELP